MLCVFNSFQLNSMLKYTFLIYVNQNFTKYIVGFMVGYFNLIESKKYSIDLRYIILKFKIKILWTIYIKAHDAKSFQHNIFKIPCTYHVSTLTHHKMILQMGINVQFDHVNDIHWYSIYYPSNKLIITFLKMLFILIDFSLFKR